ncbi:MAG: DNA-directed RNA polymerase subunit alpha C-terminal domain-containing protein [Candidatus Moraniibacteriota bacterium]
MTDLGYVLANYEKFVRDLLGSSSDLLPIREEDAEKIFEIVLSLNDEVESKHPLGDIIVQAYGLRGGVKKISEIAKECRVTRPRIDYLKSKALRLLRHPKRCNPIRRRLDRDFLDETLIFLREKLEETKKELRMVCEKKFDREISTVSIPLLNFVYIENLELSVRAVNCLHNEGILTLSQLVKINKYKLIRMKNIGNRTFHEIEEMLKELNLSFAE